MMRGKRYGLFPFINIFLWGGELYFILPMSELPLAQINLLAPHQSTNQSNSIHSIQQEI